MVPGLIISLDELPLTPNSKIDRKRLPSDLSQWQGGDIASSSTESDSADINSDADSEQNQIVRSIRQVWQQLLGHSQISRQVSYFDVGGNSFSLMLMHNELNQIWPGLIQVTDIFANPTIAALADLVTERLAQQQTALYMPLPLSDEFFDISANSSDQEGQLLVEPGATVSEQLHTLAQNNDVTMTDVLIGLQGFFLHKRFEQSHITLYLEESGAGYRPIALDFNDLTQVEAIFARVKSQRHSSTVFPVPPEVDRVAQQDCLFLVRNHGDPASAQHNRFDFQLIIDDSDTQSLALRVAFNHQRLSQQPVFRLINDYVRLSKAIIAASLEGVTS